MLLFCRERWLMSDFRSVAAELSFSTLLYRYFFFAWLFRDVNRGTVWERAAARAYNRDRSRWLPTYLRRWLVLAPLLMGLGEITESLLHQTLVSALFYVPAALSVPVVSIITVLMIYFATESTRR